MKTLKISLFLFAMLIAIASCKKGDKGDTGPAGTPGPPGPTGAGGVDTRIFNKWQVIKGAEYLLPSYYGVPVYLTIKSDNTFYMLTQDSVYGFRDYVNWVALFTSSQACLYNCENYSFNSDTLNLVNPLAGTTVCIKNTNAPDWNQWITPVTTALDSFPTPPNYYNGDIGYDGKYLWISDGYTIYKIDASTHYVTNMLTPSFSTNNMSVDYAAGYLWVSDGIPMVHKLNPTNGTDLQQSPVMGNYYIMGMAWDNQYLWCNDDYSLYKYNTSSNFIVSQDSLPSSYSFRASAYANGYFYFSTGNAINKCTLNPFKVVKSYVINFSTGNISGLAYDGANFWITDQGVSNYMFYKISLN